MDTLSTSQFFQAGGLINQVKPDFAPRSGQAELSELIMEALRDGRNVLAEAPTGFGKSFSVLVPAIIAAIQDRKRIVVSTETLTLQDQYFLNDLPLLQKACMTAGVNFSYAVAKGKTNYVCQAKLDEEKFDKASELMTWARGLTPGVDSGDVSTVPFGFDPKEWGTICCDDDCERAACPYYGTGRVDKGNTDCFCYKAARRFLTADIVVANHVLVLLDAQQGVGSILGTYDMLLVDEAHVFAEKAQDTWGVSLRPRTVSNTLRIIDKMLAKIHVPFFAPGDLEHLREAENRIFEPFKEILGQSIALKELDQAIVDKSKLEAELLLIELKHMQKSLSDYANRGESDPQTVVVRACKEKLTAIMRAIRGVYGEDIDPAYADNWLVFLETAYTTKRQPYGVLNLKPIDVAPLMRMNILDVIETSVFLSATMRTGPNFSFMRRELGIGDDCLEFVGESPFDFEKNVMGYFPTHLPDAKDPRYLDELALEILAVLKHSKGRGLVLFTNNSHMRYCYEACSARLPYNCYMQGQASKPILIDMFKSDVQSCLFATRTFFTGIDIPGEALSCLVLTKAPFQVPTDPMFKAKSEKIEDDGGNSFSMLALPLMLFDVRQGFGRLVRTTSDKGIFAFLDSRALSKSYGNRIISSLPCIPIIESLDGKPRVKKVSKSSSRTPVRAKKSALSFASIEADDD